MEEPYESEASKAARKGRWEEVRQALRARSWDDVADEMAARGHPMKGNTLRMAAGRGNMSHPMRRALKALGANPDYILSGEGTIGNIVAGASPDTATRLDLLSIQAVIVAGITATASNAPALAEAMLGYLLMLEPEHRAGDFVQRAIRVLRTGLDKASRSTAHVPG